MRRYPVRRPPPGVKNFGFWHSLPAGVRGAIIATPALTFVYLLNFWVLNGRVFARSFGDLDVTVYIWHGWWLQLIVYALCGVSAGWQADSHGMMGIGTRQFGLKGQMRQPYGQHGFIGGFLLGVVEAIFYFSSGAISGAKGAPWIELITPAVIFFVLLDFGLCVLLAGAGGLIYGRFIKPLR